MESIKGPEPSTRTKGGYKSEPRDVRLIRPGTSVVVLPVLVIGVAACSASDLVSRRPTAYLRSTRKPMRHANGGTTKSVV